MKQTDTNLRSPAATEPLTRWLIDAAKQRRTLTYTEAKHRLEKECHFEGIFTTNTGKVAGALMDKILEIDDSAPLLNVLLVKAKERLPGRGVRGYLIKRYPKERWLDNNFRRGEVLKDPRWKRIVDRAAEEVYAYRRWGKLYERVYNRVYESSLGLKGAEKDGLYRGRGGEGKNHKALRLWVKENPRQIDKKLRNARTDTEVELLSGDRIDVVCYAEERAIAIEVKSRDSNWADHRRGIYQCVKYEAVLRAQDIREDPPVQSLLVTERELEGDLKALAKRLGIKHVRVSRNKRGQGFTVVS